MKCGTRDVSKLYLLASFLFFHISLQCAAIIQEHLITPHSDQVDKVFFCPAQGKTIEAIILGLIGSAQKIYGALYLLSQKSIIEALIAAHQKGTEIQLVIDSGALSNGNNIFALARAGISLLLFDGTRFAPLMHNKFLIFKNVPKVADVVVSGSMNFTQSGLFNNAENFTVRNKSEIVTQYSRQFRELIEKCERLTLAPVVAKKRKRKRIKEDSEFPEHIAKKLATGQIARYVTQIKK